MIMTGTHDNLLDICFLPIFKSDSLLMESHLGHTKWALGPEKYVCVRGPYIISLDLTLNDKGQPLKVSCGKAKDNLMSRTAFHRLGI